MQKLTFVPLDTEKDAHIQEFERLMRLYCRELDEHDGTTTLQSFLTRWIDSIIRLQAQAETDRHLELCFLDDEPVGFLYGKVDHPHHRGLSSQAMDTSWNSLFSPPTAVRESDAPCMNVWNACLSRTVSSECI